MIHGLWDKGNDVILKITKLINVWAQRSEQGEDGCEDRKNIVAIVKVEQSVD